VGVLSALLVVEVNNVKKQQKNRRVHAPISMLATHCCVAVASVVRGAPTTYSLVQ
jgi:hypothetical protein